jgi:glucose-1-phosphate adenylyltransferase
VTAEQAPQFGILKVNRQGRIVQFEEKPSPDRLPDLVSDWPGIGETFLASMGIYVFGRAVLEQAVRDPLLTDFGRHILPRAVANQRVHAHMHRGYWEDVGTIRSYYLANLALAQPLPPFDFYDAAKPVYTHPRFLPATKVEQSTVRNALLSEGCIVVRSDIERSVLGIRSRVGAGSRVVESLLLGADYFETIEESERARAQGLPPVGIGADSVVQGAIIDKNARIGDGVRITNAGGLSEHDGNGFYIREGIVIVPKNGVIPDGTVI